MGHKKPFKLKQTAIRMVSAPPLYSEESVNTPEAAIRVMAKELKDYDREVLCVVNLQSNLQPINFNIVSMGVVDASLVHPRELLKSVFLSNAKSIILIHNHPSGTVRPSVDDIRVTDQIQQLCTLAGITMLDHVIIGGGNDREYFSFKESDVLPVERIRLAEKVGDIKWSEASVGEIAERSDKNKKKSIRENLKGKKAEIAGSKTKSEKKKSKDMEL